MEESHFLNVDSSVQVKNEENSFTEFDNNYQWISPQIEGIQPSPRGGHTATKVGRYIIIFGVF